MGASHDRSAHIRDLVRGPDPVRATFLARRVPFRASKPVSEEIQTALGSYAQSSGTPDFESAAEWLKLSPNLAGTDRRTWPVRLYFTALRAMNSVTQFIAPSKAGWWQQEMGACARYIAVVADERLQRNRLCIAEMHSF